MINYTDEAIITPFTQQEINESICRMLAFCRINTNNNQVKKLTKHLLKLEDAVATGDFKN
jgi:hypothetical protein